MKKYKKYQRTPEGWYIENADVYNKAIQDPKKYKWTKLKGYLFLLIPIVGFIPYSEYMEEELGVSIF